jgi:hypothetical protein
MDASIVEKYVSIETMCVSIETMCVSIEPMCASIAEKCVSIEPTIGAPPREPTSLHFPWMNSPMSLDNCSSEPWLRYIMCPAG